MRVRPALRDAAGRIDRGGLSLLREMAAAATARVFEEKT
jgi:hypothetical protein